MADREDGSPIRGDQFTSSKSRVVTARRPQLLDQRRQSVPDSNSREERAPTTAATGKRSTPNNARREARKLNTQSMYESWQREHRRLVKSRPNMSAVWYSQQIAKMDIAKESSPETIRKHMKK
jgi:hypothetical protein